MNILLLTSQNFAPSLGCKSSGVLGFLNGSTLLVFEAHTFLLASSLGKLNTFTPCPHLLLQSIPKLFTMLTLCSYIIGSSFTTAATSTDNPCCRPEVSYDDESHGIIFSNLKNLTALIITQLCCISSEALSICFQFIGTTFFLWLWSRHSRVCVCAHL